MSSVSEIYQFPSTAPAESSTTSTKDEIMGKEEFLTLLVAQLQNQDPLNPNDPTEFTAQLAQFSSLEQLVNLNDSMTEMTDAQIQSDRFTSIDLIGKDVVYQESEFAFDGNPVDIGYQLDGTASSVTMTIQNEYGATLATLNPTDLEAGNHFMEWDGLDSEGNIVPDGKYHIVLQANAGGDETSVAISPLIRSMVTGIDFNTETGGATLYTQAGQVNLSSIVAAYEANSKTTEETASSTEIITEAANTAASLNTTESSLKYEDQLALEQLQYYLQR
ncbi:MAG: flagellar hook assembly protein FlgD [Proteobacteria bacterium]|nr:flagellar hook assembly protein FlgD [Pseudomonadota bacterium]MBU1416953.1 flagellar hook assembly protein FlgD [Pseudomonadota bacterium]MBU1456674.1 flagellar hook assembly protein FlgD [Pseudomonadota bacterium]